MQDRQREAMTMAKAKDVCKGSPRSVTDEQIFNLKQKIEVGVPLAVAARDVGISRASEYQYLKGNE